MINDEKPSISVLQNLKLKRKSTALKGALLIGADGIHSAVRVHMHPSEDPPVWSSAVMWLATTEKIFLSGASIILSRNDAASFIVYPISNPDPEIDLSTINWIAETALNPTIQVDKEYWRRGMIKRPLCANLQRLRFRLDKMCQPLLKALTPF